jgi:hypothetical protein
MNLTAQPKWMTVTGWVLTILITFALLASGGMKISRGEELVNEFTGHLGYVETALLWIGVAEIVSVLLYAFPRTSMLGLALVTGYLGGAIATHVRLGEGFAAPVIVAMIAWFGLYFREPRLRAIIPLR